MTLEFVVKPCAILPELLFAKDGALSPYSLHPHFEALPHLALEALVEALAFLERKYGEVIAAQIHLQIALLCDFERISRAPREHGRTLLPSLPGT